MPVSEDQERAIEQMVRLFYERGRADPFLGPIFNAAIHDWEAHIAVVRDFWLGAVHGADRYKGNAFAPHMKLDFGPEAFDHWIATLESAARDTLPPVDAATAIRVARHMAESFKMGLFPFIDADGRPSRTPQRKAL